MIEEAAAAKAAKEAKKRKQVAAPKRPKSLQPISLTQDSSDEDLGITMGLSHPEAGIACLYCEESYTARGDTWAQCIKCHQWAHVLCRSIEGEVHAFMCEFCQDM